MSLALKKIKTLGVLNCTPNSFSDGGSIQSLGDFKSKLASFGSVDGIDMGAESTAPMNSSIDWLSEWERLKPYLSLVKNFSGVISFDTYHPETIQKIVDFYFDQKMNQKLIWNDISGKCDEAVWNFLKISSSFMYVFSHNLAPTRELSGKHMNYVDEGLSLNQLIDYFLPRKHPQIIFDPCLGFSKTYEQNWMILENFNLLQEKINHPHWLIGFSRKSFLRKRFNLNLDQLEELDVIHGEILNQLKFTGQLWVRTHRPELII